LILHLRQLTGDYTLFGLGALAVIVSAALYPIAASMGRAGGSTPEADPRIAELLQSINDRMLISDTAKRIAYRQRDRDALRDAIRADIGKHDYEAALALVSEMGQTYGYRREAEDFREQILLARKAEVDQRVADGIASLDLTLQRHEWDAAQAEVDKLGRLYSDSPRVKGLDRRVSDAKEQHKHTLERQFLQAAERDDVDNAIELLKELDRYLTESEAEPFRETARGVIGKKRENLGVQFKLSVHDKEWMQAVRVGEQIIREFPNTKMADEVRTKMDLLRARAAGQRAAEAQGPRV
jgi:hypothetical protein